MASAVWHMSAGQGGEVRREAALISDSFNLQYDTVSISMEERIRFLLESNVAAWI